MKNSFSNVSRKWILPNMIRAGTANASVNSHQRWKQTRNRVCFHPWCELTLALWCHSIVWSPFSWYKMYRNDKFHGIHPVHVQGCRHWQGAILSTRVNIIHHCQLRDAWPSLVVHYAGSVCSVSGWVCLPWAKMQTVPLYNCPGVFFKINSVLFCSLASGPIQHHVNRTMKIPILSFFLFFLVHCLPQTDAIG